MKKIVSATVVSLLGIVDLSFASQNEHERVKMPLSLRLGHSLHRRAIAEAPTGFQTTTPSSVSLDELFTVEITAQGAGGEISRTLPIDIVFAIDSSGSMGGSDPQNLRLEAAKLFVDQLDNSRDAGAVVSWDDNIDFTFPATGLTSDFDALKAAIDTVDSSGGTNLNVGLLEAISVLDSNTRPDNSAEAIIFLTDGGGTYTFAADGGPASDAASKGYTIYSIGLGSGTIESYLIDMANATGGQYFDSPSAENIEQIFMEILMEILASTVPTNVDVITQTNSYIDVDQATIIPTPDSVVTNGDGTTTIEWLNIDAGNGLPGGETRVFTYSASSSMEGLNLQVDVDLGTQIRYTDSDGQNPGVALLGPAFIDVPAIDVMPPTIHPSLTPGTGKGYGGKGKGYGGKGGKGNGKGGKRNGKGGKGNGKGGSGSSSGGKGKGLNGKGKGGTWYSGKGEGNRDSTRTYNEG